MTQYCWQVDLLRHFGEATTAPMMAEFKVSFRCQLRQKVGF
jgi:hypothetical protein